MMKSSTGVLASSMAPVLSKSALGLTAFICLVLDQLVKYAVRTGMTPGQSIPVIQDIFHITYVHNTGVAFSLLQQQPQLLLILTSLLFLGFLVFAFRQAGYSRSSFAGFAMVLGGAAGNITDRMLYGKVIDYLDATIIQYPVFNLADSFICVGVGLLLIYYWRAGYDGTDAAV